MRVVWQRQPRELRHLRLRAMMSANCQQACIFALRAGVRLE